jgi:hypothetical protein
MEVKLAPVHGLRVLETSVRGQVSTERMRGVCVAFGAMMCAACLPCAAYSVLTHEAIVDSAWESRIQPLLRARYPQATEDDLREARAYVYGGSLVQDMGYAPLSSKTFSDLTHYVRSGDFVAALLTDAKSLDEYAFALGALAHYASDRIGHQTVNRLTPLIYPKLKKKFGDVVTYEDSPSNHLKTEFALDVVQVSRGLYAPDAYHAFIGFKVSQDVLERAFEDTYGFPLKDLFLSEDLAIGTYRYAAGSLIPQMTTIAWTTKQKDIEQLKPGIERSAFIYSLPRAKYESEWGTKYQKPGIFTRILAWVFRVIPKVGPFKAMGFRPVPPEGEKMFLKAFADTSTEYNKLLDEVKSNSLVFTDVNLDTGKATQPGEYQLADKAYVSLLDRLSGKHVDAISPQLRANMLAYFDRRDRETLSQKALQQLAALRAANTASR